jgi:hypothetical protein
MNVEFDFDKNGLQGESNIRKRELYVKKNETPEKSTTVYRRIHLIGSGAQARHQIWEAKPKP